MLFDIVPESFFSPLASPGKLVYWECLNRLFAITNRQMSFGVERDVLVDDLEFYFESEMSADLPDDEILPSLSSRDKANYLLRQFEKFGWIYVDTDYSYVQRVNFRDYAVKIMKTLLDISEEKHTEYQGYIYTIYNLARATGNPGLSLMQILENTDALITGLKTLNANIKQYIDDLTKQSTVAEILDALLNDYYSNVVDKAYHRLKTADNVSKFRPEILERLEAKSRSTRFMNAASAEVAELKELTLEEARDDVLSMLHTVIEAFRQMDDILEEIDKKNNRYQSAAVNRARFMLTNQEDIRGQLKDILGYLNTEMHARSLDMNGIHELEEINDLIRIFSWHYLDMDSLYAPVEGKKVFEPEIQSVLPIDEELRQKKRDEMRQRLNRILSPEKIDSYVLGILGNRSQITASQMLQEMLPSQEDAFIRLIYVRLYGQRKNMAYRIETLGEIDINGYHFRDFIIIRRKKR